MAVTSVTPTALLTSAVQTGGQSVQVAGPNPNGGWITNPLEAADQGLETAEVLYVDCVGQGENLAANTTTFALQPGQTWSFIPGQVTATYVNCASGGHRFSGVIY